MVTDIVWDVLGYILEFGIVCKGLEHSLEWFRMVRDIVWDGFGWFRIVWHGSAGWFRTIWDDLGMTASGTTPIGE
jgi:hypothetical protein